MRSIHLMTLEFGTKNDQYCKKRIIFASCRQKCTNENVSKPLNSSLCCMWNINNILLWPLRSGDTEIRIALQYIKRTLLDLWLTIGQFLFASIPKQGRENREHRKIGKARKWKVEYNSLLIYFRGVPVRCGGWGGGGGGGGRECRYALLGKEEAWKHREERQLLICG